MMFTFQNYTNFISTAWIFLLFVFAELCVFALYVCIVFRYLSGDTVAYMSMFSSIVRATPLKRPDVKYMADTQSQIYTSHPLVLMSTQGDGFSLTFQVTQTGNAEHNSAALCMQSMQTRLGWLKLVILPENINIIFNNFICFYFKIFSGFLPHQKGGWTGQMDRTGQTKPEGQDQTDGWVDR
jgi:hypothetical protein